MNTIQIPQRKHLPQSHVKLSRNGFNKNFSLFTMLQGYEEFFLNVQGIIISSNLEAVNITGYEEWEVIGTHFSKFYTEEEIENAMPEKDLAVAQKKGKVARKTFMLKRKRISFVAEISVTALKNQEGEMTGYRMVLKDLTHKEVYDLKLRKLKDEYTHLFQNSFIGIIKFKASDGSIIFLNDKAKEILDIDKNEKFSTAFRHDFEYADLQEQLKKHEKVVGFEFELFLNSATRAWASIDCTDIGLDGIMEGIIYDITAKVVQKQKLEKVNQELDTFIYHASHELRSPLSSVLGLVNLINLSEVPSDMKTYSSMIGERIRHLDKLLRDISVIAFNNNSEMIIEKIYLHEEVQAIVKDLQTENPQPKVHIEIFEEAEWHTDLIRMRVILKNLISNALKYSNSICANQYVTITARVDKSKAVVEVEDNGMGMDALQLNEIYNLFYRGSSNSSGAGLGLYVVKQIVDKMHGMIGVRSELSKGTIFIIEIPNHRKDLV